MYCRLSLSPLLHLQHPKCWDFTCATTLEPYYFGTLLFVNIVLSPYQNISFKWGRGLFCSIKSVQGVQARCLIKQTACFEGLGEAWQPEFKPQNPHKGEIELTDCTKLSFGIDSHTIEHIHINTEI